MSDREPVGQANGGRCVRSAARSARRRTGRAAERYTMQQREILRSVATARHHATLVTRRIEELEQLYQQAADADGVPVIVSTLEELERCRWTLSVLHFNLVRGEPAQPPDTR